MFTVVNIKLVINVLIGAYILHTCMSTCTGSGMKRYICSINHIYFLILNLKRGAPRLGSLARFCSVSSSSLSESWLKACVIVTCRVLLMSLGGAFCGITGAFFENPKENFLSPELVSSKLDTSSDSLLTISELLDTSLGCLAEDWPSLSTHCDSSLPGNVGIWYVDLSPGVIFANPSVTVTKVPADWNLRPNFAILAFFSAIFWELSVSVSCGLFTPWVIEGVGVCCGNELCWLVESWPIGLNAGAKPLWVFLYVWK